MNFKLIPIDFDNKENEALAKSISIFNKSQNNYSLKKDANRKFNNESSVNWKQIYNHLLPEDDETRIIGITSKPFNDNWFSHTGNKVTVISTADWRKYYSPPGIHCYLLIEFILAMYLQSSNFEENETQPHIETIGCLLDLCANKTDMIWKLRTGYLCSEHASLFKTHGGTEAQLKAIQKLLQQVRNVTLGLTIDNSKQKRNHKFTIESIKANPIVVAGIIFFFSVSIGWGAAWKLWIEPQASKIEQLESDLENMSNIKDSK